jgi:hypothetical protein
MSGDNLSFDPTEPVVQFGTEHGRPLRHPRPEAQTSAPPPAATAPQVSAPPRQYPQARAVMTEGQNSTKPKAPVQPQNVQRPAGQQAPRPTQPVRQQMQEVEEPEQPVAQAVSNNRPKLPLSVTGPRAVTASYEDIWLPSEFVSYPWKDLQIRRFNIEELRAMIRARTSGNLRHLIRAVDATLSRPITDMTQGDFWYIMYWHRLNSYKKSPFVIEWVCDHDDHLRKVGAGESAPETLRNLLTVSRSNLDTVAIDKEQYAALQDKLFTEYGVRVRPQNIVDFISAVDEDEELEHARKLAREKRQAAVEDGDVDAFLDEEDEEEIGANEDRSFIYRYAALLDNQHGESLADRAAWLNTQEPDLLVDLEDFLKVSDHGVTESWNVVCKECGAPKIVKQSLDALTFLPSLQRGGLA